MKGKILFGLIVCMAIVFATACKANFASLAGSSVAKTDQRDTETSALEEDIPLDEVHFPGKYFREYLGHSYDENSDGVLSRGEAGKITKIKMEWDRDKYDSDSLDITGIQHLKNVQTVHLEHWHFLTGAEELEQLPSLKKLRLWGLQHELPVYHMDSLEVLVVAGPLCMEKLDVRYLPNLKTLRMIGDSLAAWFRLKKYDTKLLVREQLDVSANKQLETLECPGLGLKSLDVSGNPKLRILRCNANQLKKITLPANGRLEVLDCNENYLKKLDFSNIRKLRVLSCSYNRFQSLDLKKSLKITRLECDENKLESLDVNMLKNLRFLFCRHNKLTKLQLAHNPKLHQLLCDRNRISSLDMRKNPKLYDLSCDQNRISSLDLSRNPELYMLSCSKNRISSLDMRKNPKLYDLSCNHNRISSLDLSQNKNLSTLTELAENNMKYISLPSKMTAHNDSYYVWINVQGNHFLTIDIGSIKKLDKMHRKNVEYWITGGVSPKDADKITVKTLIASKKLSKSDSRFIQKLGKKYKLTVKFV